MKIVVTGGSGFLGSHVADELSNRGHKVTIFDKKQSKWIRSDQKMYKGDILNRADLDRVMKGADAVFHFAALADMDEAVKKPIETSNINIFGTVLTLEACRRHRIKRFIHASTIYVNSKDGGFYRCSKKAAEEYVEEFHNVFGINYTVLRFGSLYGERADDTNGVTSIIRRAIKTGTLSYLGNKKSVREYIHVKDAAKATVDILKKKYKNKYIILTGKEKIKVYDFLKILSGILKIIKKIKFLNKKLLGHYVLSPFTYKLKNGKKFTINSNIDFKSGLLELVEVLKKKS